MSYLVRHQTICRLNDYESIRQTQTQKTKKNLCNLRNLRIKIPRNLRIEMSQAKTTYPQISQISTDGLCLLNTSPPP
jgi:hypothetical protein